MPAYAGSLSPEDAREIARHVRSLARPPIWEERDPARIATAGIPAEPRRRGRYLVRAMQCPLCHTPISGETGAYDERYFLAGGMRVSAYPWGVWYSRNLTSDADTGLGRWSEAEIVDAITRGVSREGRRLDPMAMPWPWFSRLNASDARAIAVYLKSLPPVVNVVPDAHHVSVGERAGGMLLALLGVEAAVEFWGGNSAVTRPDGEIPVGSGRRLAAHAVGWSLAGLAAGALMVGVRRRRRSPLVIGGMVTVGWVTRDRKNGNRYLSWAYVEAGNFAVRYSARAQAFHQRKSAKTKNVVAIKALANKLARASFYILRDQSAFDENRLYG